MVDPTPLPPDVEALWRAFGDALRDLSLTGALTGDEQLDVTFTVEGETVVMRSSDPRVRATPARAWDEGLTDAFAPHPIPSLALSDPEVNGGAWALALLTTPTRVPMDVETLMAHIDRARAVNEVTLDSERFEDEAIEALDVLWRVQQGFLAYDEDEQRWYRPIQPSYAPHADG